MGLLKGTQDASGVNSMTLDTKPVKLTGLLPATANGQAVTYEQLSGGDANPVFQSVSTDTINEETSAAGVTVDSVLLKDADVTADALILAEDITLAKEVAHNIVVSDTTTPDTAGGDLLAKSGDGDGTGDGGGVIVEGGAAGATGMGGIIYLISGEATEGSSGDVDMFSGDVATLGNSGNIGIGSGSSNTSGDSGYIGIMTGPAAIGGTGNIELTTGNTASGVAGDIILETGTGDSATVVPVISLNKAVVKKPLSSAHETGDTVTGVELVNGLLTVTQGTGFLTLPDTADITTAIGSTPAGTEFDFTVNAVGMTATNVVTLVVGASMSVVTTPIVTGSDVLTVAQDVQVVGKFKIIFDSATTCKLFRIA